MKILFLPKYNLDGPSSRYRTYQYINLFKEKDIVCTISSFYLKGYVRNLYHKKWLNIMLFPFCILRRIIITVFSFNYDLVVIEKEAIPYFPPIVEKVLSIFGKKFILDYDDAVYYNYIYSNNKLVRRLFSNKIESIIKISFGVITGSPELTEYVKQFNANVIEIPTSVDIEKYNSPSSYIQKNSPFVIGWIGSISTSRYIDSIQLGLNRFLEEVDDVEIHLIGYNGYLRDERIKVIKWTSDTEVENLYKMDVGIMPLIDTPFEHGKCGFKLIQYMACGKSTISTPFDANIKIDSGNGNLFALNDDEWFKCFMEVYNSPQKYKDIGCRNKQRVLEEYSIQSNVEKYVNFYHSI